MSVMNEIDDILKSLESNISYLLEAIKISEYEEININKIDMFQKIIVDINKLNSYNKQYLGEIGMSLQVVSYHLVNMFFDQNGPKESIKKADYENIANCYNEIKVLEKKITNNTPFNKYFERLKYISKNLKIINQNAFLNDDEVTKNNLLSYKQLLIKYLNLLGSIDDIKLDMRFQDYENMNIDLSINYSGLKSNLKEIYLEIINSNNDIADPLLSRLKKYIATEDYDSVLKSSMVNKHINYNHIVKKLKNNLDILIQSLDSLIVRYENTKISKKDIKIDIDLSNSKTKSDYDIDIPNFIEDNYNSHRILDSRKKSNHQTYDEKLKRYIKRFERLKKQFEQKKVLSKEEVRLYNRIESELDLMKNNKESFLSTIKFNYYYNKLLKKIKLYKNSPYKNQIKEPKKRR